MFSVTEAQLLAWLNPLLWPFIRTLALFAGMPTFSQRNVPLRLRIGLSLFIAVAAQPSLPEMPITPLDSLPTLLLLVAQQLLIGLSMGFAVRIVFAGVEFAGELIGLQMGLNFAGFFDPASGGEATAASRFFGVCIGWIFIVTGGHLLLIAAVIQSFQAFPVGPEPFAFLRTVQPQTWGMEIFRLGLWIALPMIAMLLFVNLVLDVISRVAQQMNIFSIGFPVTLSVGLIGMLITLPTLQMPFTMALERMLAYFQ